MQTIDIDNDQYISPIPYTTKRDMVDKLCSHGWDVSQSYNNESKIIVIRGPWSGVCWVEIPDYELHDHASALQDVYKVVGHAMSDVMGISGRA